MKNADKITPAEALEIAEEEYSVSVSKVTMQNWCINRGIGIKIAGRWYVYKKRLKWLLEGMEWRIKEDKKKNP